MPLQTSAEKALGKKEKIAIIAGFFLIVCVFVFTFVRSLNWGKSAQNAASISGSADQVVPDYETISSNDLKQKIQKKENVTVLDVRSFDEYIQNHIIDSINVPADEIGNSDKINLSDAIVVVGSDSNDATIGKAVDSLRNKHVQNTKVLAGGILAWEGSGGQTITFGDPTSFVDQAKVFYADTQKAHDMIQNNSSNILVLDVRDQADFVQGHVANAVNIPLLDLEKRRNEIPSLKKILIFGVTDVAEFQAGVQLYDLKQITAYVVKGGLKSWQDAKFEITK